MKYDTIPTEKINKAITELVSSVSNRGVAIPTDDEKYYQPLYTALTVIMTDFVSEHFGGKFPGLCSARRMVRGAHPYFDHVLRHPVVLDDFCITYHFVRATWDFRYDEP